MIEFKQKYLTKERIFRIEDKGLRYQRVDAGKFIDELYKWENIGFEEVIMSQLPSKFESVLFFSLLFNLLFFFIPFTFDGNSAVIGAVIGIFTVITIFLSNRLFTKKFEKILTGGYNISFFYFEKHKNEVDNFIEVLRKKKIDFLKNKYLVSHQYDNLESYNDRISWLRDEEIITDDEYQIFRKNKHNLVKGFIS